MPSSHLCVHCGYDLARVRAQRDPDLRIWLVQCPQCTRFAARQRHHPAVLWFREFRKLDWTLGLLAVQTILLFFATLFSMLGVVYTADELFRREFARQEVEIAIIYFIFPIMVGIWLTAGFPHLARWKVWLGWGAWLLFIIMFGFVIMFCDALGSHWWYGNYLNGTPTIPERLIEAYRWTDGDLWWQGALYLPWQMAVMWLGWPFGRFARWFFVTARRGMFRFRLRRRRLAFQN